MTNQISEIELDTSDDLNYWQLSFRSATNPPLGVRRQRNSFSAGSSCHVV